VATYNYCQVNDIVHTTSNSEWKKIKQEKERIWYHLPRLLPIACEMHARVFGGMELENDTFRIEKED